MMNPNLVPRRKLFHLLGTDFSVTSDGWKSLVLALIIGALLAFIFNRHQAPVLVVINALTYAVLLQATVFVHTLGHIFAARSVDAPMSENVITLLRHHNIYQDGDQTHPREIHTSRAIGGLLANLTIATVSFILWAFDGGGTLLFFAITNLLWGLGSMLPVTGLDGDVLFRGGGG